jgi:hypothetical protein
LHAFVHLFFIFKIKTIVRECTHLWRGKGEKRGEDSDEGRGEKLYIRFLYITSYIRRIITICTLPFPGEASGFDFLNKGDFDANGRIDERTGEDPRAGLLVLLLSKGEEGKRGGRVVVPVAALLVPRMDDRSTLMRINSGCVSLLDSFANKYIK